MSRNEAIMQAFTNGEVPDDIPQSSGSTGEILDWQAIGLKP